MSLSSTEPAPDSKALTLIAHVHLGDVYLMSAFTYVIQAGSGNPTAQKNYIKHLSYRKLQTCLSPSIHCQNTRKSCLQPCLIVCFPEQQTGR